MGYVRDHVEFRRVVILYGLKGAVDATPLEKVERYLLKNILHQFMSTSVKISSECKRLLDKLQARLVITKGRKISQQELLDTVVRLSTEKEDELIRYMAGISLPLPPEEVERLMKLPTDWGVETGEEEVDKYLYGGKEVKRK